MTSATQDPIPRRAADDKPVERHFGDVAPVPTAHNAADVRARAAADRMWGKVAEDLEKIDSGVGQVSSDD